MSTTEFSSMCQEVEERLSEVVDGTASARLFDHIASCDACRDLRYEATRVAELVGGSGKDFRPADDFVEKLAARLAEARPGYDGAASGPKPQPLTGPDDHAAPVASAPRESAPRSMTSRGVDSGNVVIQASTRAPGMETAATLVDPERGVRPRRRSARRGEGRGARGREPA